PPSGGAGMSAWGARLHPPPTAATARSVASGRRILKMDFIFRIKGYHRPVVRVNERGGKARQEGGDCSIQDVSACRSRTDARAPANNTAARTTLRAGTMYIASCSPWARKASVMTGEEAAAAARAASRSERTPVPTGPSEAPIRYMAQK